MIELPKRSDSIYKEIEAFETYEFTNCIAYEMAIRNKEVISINKKIGLVLNLKRGINYNKYLDLLIFHDKNFRDEIKELTTYGLIYNYIIKYLFANEKVPIFSEVHTEYLRKILNYEEIQKVCDIERGLHNYLVLEEFEDTKKRLLKEMKDNDSVEIDLDILETNKDYLERYPLTIEVIMHTKSKEIIKNALKRKQLTKIKNMYSRPKIRPENTNFLQVKINPNLPKDELIAYISKIKDEYDNDNSIIKTPLELLGEDLEKSDNKHTQKKPKAEKWADWFYIYDYWKFEKSQGKTDKDIFVNLEVENDIPYKEENIRKIRDKMKYFIEDLGYKELITGIKNNDW